MKNYLIILTYISLLVTGCCSERRNYCVTINKTQVVAYNNNDAEPVLANNTGVYGEALMLELNFHRNVAICYNRIDNSFFTSAYATSCKTIEDYNFDDSVTHVTIYANKDYDAQHPAGAELNIYFKMPDVSEFNQGKESTTFRMYALKAPEQSGEYIYTVRVLLADGRTIEAPTESVNIIQ